MALIYDNRANNGNSAGLHILIAGVSYYEYLPGGSGQETARSFGMKQLSSPAISAFSFYQWLMENDAHDRLPAKIATVRLLLSPSDDELSVEPNLGTIGASACTRENFETDTDGWRTDASTNKDDVTFFYFCGHGVQRRADDAVILFEDFGQPGKPMLSRAAEINNIYLGMATPLDPTETIAQNQFYIVDACRMLPEEFKLADWLSVPPIWDTESSVDDRTSPVFYAAIPGTEALGRPKERSYFCEALLNCLNGNGGDNLFDAASGSHRWQVTSLNLVRALKFELAEMNLKYQTTLNFEPGGKNKEMIINYLPGVPTFDLNIEIDPGEASPLFALTLTDIKTKQVTQLGPPLLPKHKVPITSGLYDISAQINPPQPTAYRDFSNLDMYTPLRRFLNVRVS